MGIRMGQEFTMMMHVSVSPEQKKNLLVGLNSREEFRPLNLKISSLTRRQTGMYVPALYGLRIHCVGEDKPGMLAAITENLVNKGMAIENITTELRQGKKGRSDFVVNTDVTTTADLNDAELKEFWHEMEDPK